MKKTLLSLFAILMATVAFAGDGTKENPYTVAEVQAFTPMDGTVTAYVKGYIVGTVPSGSSIKSFTTDAGEKASNTNLFLADSQTETDYNVCIPIQLPAGDVRSGLNLRENPTNLGKTAVLLGKIDKYFGVPGVKSVSEFTLSGETTYTGDGGEGGGDDPGTTTQTNYIFTKATSLTNGGKYLIGATVDGVVKVAQNLPSSSSYGYLKVTDATETDGKIKTTSLEDIYTISGSNIIDSQNRYVYQTGTYNSFNVAADASEGIDWTITFNEDGTVMITNDDVQKTIQYDGQYGSYGSYDDVRGIYPALYLLTGTEEVTPKVPVETPVSTIAAVQAGEAGKYRIQGTVVATCTRGALVYDTTGYIYIYDTAISAAVGEQVTVEGTTSEYGGFKQFSASNKYTLTKTGTTTVTHPAAVELDLDAWVAAPVMQYVKLTGNLAISGNYYNVTVDGKTAVGSLVYPTDEIKAKLADGEITVYGYAVYTSGSSTKYVNIIVTSVDGEDVGPVETPVSTIAAVQAGDAGNYKVQGTVVATCARGALIHDTTGYIYIYDTAISAAVGEQVTVEGTTSEYGGFKQFSASNKYTLTKTGTTTVTHPAAVELDLDAWVAAPVMQYVKLTGNLAISGNYYNVTVDGKTAVGSLVYPTDEIKAKLADGEITVYGYAVYTSGSSTKYVNIIVTSVGSDTAVKGIDANQKAQEIYDLAGRRVSRMTKGLYIVGGKKILK